MRLQQPAGRRPCRSSSDRQRMRSGSEEVHAANATLAKSNLEECLQKSQQPYNLGMTGSSRAFRMIAWYVQVQAATAAAATTRAALQEDKSALESRIQDTLAACAALEAKVEISL